MGHISSERRVHTQMPMQDLDVLLPAAPPPEPESRTCPNCGQSRGEDEDWHTVRTDFRDYQEWCEDCRHSDTTRCSQCDETIADSHIYSDNSISICRWC